MKDENGGKPSKFYNIRKLYSYDDILVVTSHKTLFI